MAYFNRIYPALISGFDADELLPLHILRVMSNYNFKNPITYKKLKTEILTSVPNLNQTNFSRRVAYAVECLLVNGSGLFKKNDKTLFFEPNRIEKFIYNYPVTLNNGELCDCDGVLLREAAMSNEEFDKYSREIENKRKKVSICSLYNIIKTKSSIDNPLTAEKILEIFDEFDYEIGADLGIIKRRLKVLKDCDFGIYIERGKGIYYDSKKDRWNEYLEVA